MNKSSIKDQSTSTKRHYKRTKIPTKTQLKLWVMSAGRCEVNGCNEFLLRDGLTLSETNYSNIAHIVGAKKNGPRGDDPMSLSERNKITNLLLVCTKHHTLIDSEEHKRTWTKERLLRSKQQHESRIHWVTSFDENYKTTILRLRGKIGNQAVEIPFEHVCEAVFPNYPADPLGIDIDFTQIGQPKSEEEWQSLAKNITQKLEMLYLQGVSSVASKHISVFALAPIPLLVHLGSCLSNKIPVDLFQRHRNGENWKWNNEAEPITFKLEVVHHGSNKNNVVLIISISGSISTGELPKEFLETYTVYEIAPARRTPNPLLLKTKNHLDLFRAIYHEFLGLVKASHPAVEKIHLFPAVPIPVAITCGRELLPKAHPSLLVYDFDKNNGGFKYALKVN